VLDRPTGRTVPPYRSIPFAFNVDSTSGPDKHAISDFPAFAFDADFPTAVANDTGC